MVKPIKIDVPCFVEDLPNNPTGAKVPISYRLYDSLCETLLYCFDRKFALQAAELTYAFCQVKFEEPVMLTTTSNTDPEYYTNRKNQLYCELMESLH